MSLTTEEAKKKHREYQRRYLLKYPGRAAQNLRAWRLKNPRLAYEKKKDYERRNPGKAKIWRVKWWKSTAGRILKRKRKRIDKINRRAKEKNNNGKLSQNLAIKLLELQHNKCAYCADNLKKTKFHLDHIYPLALNGENSDENIQLLCPTCNMNKGAKHPIEFRQECGYLI